MKNDGKCGNNGKDVYALIFTEEKKPVGKLKINKNRLVVYLGNCRRQDDMIEIWGRRSTNKDLDKARYTLIDFLKSKEDYFTWLEFRSNIARMGFGLDEESREYVTLMTSFKGKEGKEYSIEVHDRIHVREFEDKEVELVEGFLGSDCNNFFQYLSSKGEELADSK